MFDSKKRIRFTQDGFTSPTVGNVWVGREVVLPKSTADAFINSGVAEEVTFTPPARKEVKKNSAITDVLQKIMFHFRVTKVETEDGAEDEIYILQDDDGNEVASGSLTELQKQVDEHYASLLGSSVQPATFALADGTELPLGDVVRTAYQNSGVTTADEWNALAEDARESFIAEVVNGLKLAPAKEESNKDDSNRDAGRNKGSSKGKSSKRG